MNKKLLFVMAITAATLVMPGTAQASEYFNPAEFTGPAVQFFMNLIDNGNIPVEIQYATEETGIYLEPTTESEPYDISQVNTTFEIVTECNGWSVITTQDGFAYVQSEFLSDEPVGTYSKEDLYYLTGALVGECQGYSWEHQVAVGSVVLNRVEHEEYPNTVKEVIHDPGQYACIKNGMFYREPTQRNENVAEYLLENGSQIPNNVIYQSTVPQGSGIWRKIDNHYFCYE